MPSSEQETCALSQQLIMTADERPTRIRWLNDELRQRHLGGRIMVTRGVEALGLITVTAVLDAIRRFDGFGADNDPYHEHDMGGVDVAGQRILWKIDYYDARLEHGSPDPSDAAVTSRVLTVMLASEY